MPFLDKSGLQVLTNQLVKAENIKINSPRGNRVDKVVESIDRETGVVLEPNFLNMESDCGSIDLTSENKDSFCSFSIEGKTLQNLITQKRVQAPSILTGDKFTINTPSSWNGKCYIGSNLLKRGVKYSIVHFIEENTFKTPLYTYWKDLNENTTPDTKVIPSGFNGVFIQVMTIKDNYFIGDNCYWVEPGRVEEGSAKLKMMILEGEWSVEEISVYFEGIKSLGETDPPSLKYNYLYTNAEIVEIYNNMGYSNVSATLEDGMVKFPSNIGMWYDPTPLFKGKPSTRYTIQIGGLTQNAYLNKLRLIRTNSDNSVVYETDSTGEFCILVKNDPFSNQKVNFIIAEGEYSSLPLDFDNSNVNKINILSRGKNLLPENWRSSEDSILNIYRGVKVDIALSKDKQYKVSCKFKEGFQPIDGALFAISSNVNPNNGKYTALMAGGKFVTDRILPIGSEVTGYNGYYVTLYKTNGISEKDYQDFVDNIEFIQIEEGNKTTPYEPYQSDEKNILLPFEGGLKSSYKGICDEIINDKIIQRVGKVTLPADAKWVSRHEDENIIRFELNTPLPEWNMKYGQILICDKFPSKEAYGSGEEGIDCHINGNFHINILKSKLSSTTVDGFKEWLSKNPVTVYFELKTPIEYSLDTQMNTKTFDDKAYIGFQNSSTPKAMQTMGKIVFNGSENENWLKTGWATQVNTLGFDIDFINNFDNPVGKIACDSFKVEAFGGIDAKDMELITVSSKYNKIGIRINKSRLATQDVAGFKAWLQANPVTVYYKLEALKTIKTPGTIRVFKNGNVKLLNTMKSKITIRSAVNHSAQIESNILEIQDIRNRLDKIESLLGGTFR